MSDGVGAIPKSEAIMFRSRSRSCQRRYYPSDVIWCMQKPGQPLVIGTKVWLRVGFGQSWTGSLRSPWAETCDSALSALRRQAQGLGKGITAYHINTPIANNKLTPPIAHGSSHHRGRLQMRQRHKPSLLSIRLQKVNGRVVTSIVPNRPHCPAAQTHRGREECAVQSDI